MNDPLPVAAGIADPAAPVALVAADAPEADPRAVVGILRANKVPLLDLPIAACPAAIGGSDAWREALRAEASARDAQRAAFGVVSERLKGAGIEHVLFKSSGGFPYRSSNVDTLVAPARLEKAARILAQAGHLRMPHYREEHKLLFHRFAAGRSILSVHLHDAVSWGRVVILPGDDVVARAIPSQDGAQRIASPSDRVVTLLAHALYETDQIRLSDLRTLRIAAADPSFSWSDVSARVGERGWEEGFHAMIVMVAAIERRLFGASCVPADLLGAAKARMDESAWAGRYARGMAAGIARASRVTMPLPLSRINSKVHFVERLMRQTDVAPDHRLADVAAAGWNLVAGRLKLRARPGVVVSFSGLDGSGKSMVVRRVHEAMATCEIPVRTVWSRGGFTGWMAALKRHGRRVLPIPGPGAAEEKRRWLYRPVLGSVYAWAVLVEQLAHHLFAIAMPRALGWSVVCDRHAYDTAADLLAKAGPRPGIVAATKLLMGLTRRPDLAILLELEASEAIRRKSPDVPVAQLEGAAAALDRIARTQGLVRIDASRSDDAVIHDAVERSLRAAFARFRSGSGRP